MHRLFPRSLLGQMILLMGAALFLAQLVNFSFLLSGQQKLSLAQSEGPAVTRFVQTATQVAAAQGEAERLQALGRRGRRSLAWSLDAASAAERPGVEKDDALARRLSSALADAGVDVRATQAGRSYDLNQMRRSYDATRQRESGRWMVLLLSAQLPDGGWLNARMVVPRPDPLLGARLALATLVLYVLVLGAMLWIAARITRPLRELTRAAESFEGHRDAQEVELRGPADVRQAIDAFNAMNRRVAGLLDEKDRMLGAIGHDLRTPLAAMRIRAESLEPEEERTALIRTIGEMSETLEDILVLARTGRAREPERRMDVSALADAVVEEFRTTGARVEFEESPRAVADVQPNLLRRAVRNLIDNAVKYGGGARVRVKSLGQGVAIEVDDDGPGIPAGQIATVLQPFERLESSRSRETGGAGLGLAIATSVAEAHGGTLSLENRPQGGLRATITLAGPVA